MALWREGEGRRRAKPSENIEGREENTIPVTSSVLSLVFNDEETNGRKRSGEERNENTMTRHLRLGRNDEEN
jgi:hypothetical protein